MNLTFWGRSLVTRRFGLHSNSRGADEIKGFPISIDFCNRCYSCLVLYLHVTSKPKKKTTTKKYSTVIDNFYFLVLDYLKSWLNLVIVSMFILESRQVGDVRNREPQTRWLSVNARVDTLSLNPLMPGGNKKGHTYLNAERSAADLFKYV